MEEFKECSSSMHRGKSSPSPYPKDKVPVSLFRQDPQSPTSKICRTCWHCRQKDKELNGVRKNKRITLVNKQKEVALKTENPVLYCPGKFHDSSAQSIYPRNAVPIDHFRKEPGNIRSELWEWCKDCRSHNADKHHDHIIKRHIEADAKGIILCAICCRDITDNRVYNLDGTLSKSCSDCKEYTNKHASECRQEYNDIKLERIREHQCSCYRCKALYFKPSTESSLIINKIDTCLKEDGSRYCIINSIEYPVKYILDQCESQLELAVIELDHLTMIEQLDRKLIRSPEEYVPKKHNVSNLDSISDMRLESYKCQHLCCKCHLIVTMEREIGENYSTSSRASLNRRAKISYVNSFKCKGCVSCGLIDENLLRFFDMNHIAEKLNNIGTMVSDDSVSLEKLVGECKNCEVLCKFCHRVLTQKQKALGIFFSTKTAIEYL